jgi:polyhydroxyalkanoate synthesis regulator phasin
MFEQQQWAQMMIFNMVQNYTTATSQMMKTSMEQYEKAFDTMVKQGLVMQEDGQKLFNDWTSKARQAQQQYWKTMDENMKKMETFFNPQSK